MTACLPSPFCVQSPNPGAYILAIPLTFHALVLPHQDLSTQRLSGGARIRAVFNSLYVPALRDLVPNRDVSDEAILTVIKNGAGVAGGWVGTSLAGILYAAYRAATQLQFVCKTPVACQLINAQVCCIRTQPHGVGAAPRALHLWLHMSLLLCLPTQATSLSLRSHLSC
jgi:hypothetical protein